jgi:tRNA-dihydrouridine synthase A
MPDHTLSVAPMMGYTDRHCRTLFRLISPSALLYTEMVVTGALLRGDAGRFLDHEADSPCTIQLGGSDPVELARCARMAEDAGYQEVNLNVGCPSDKVQSGRIGACLMAEPDLVADCVHAMRSAVRIPVTVKSRIGIDDHNDFEFFHHFVSTVRSAGCDTFIVHARSAILSGLSPRENREIPPLHYDFVYRIKSLMPECRFILNGGLTDAAAVLQVLPQVDGVMLGRAICSDPWLLTSLESALFSRSVTRERLAVLAAYREYMVRQTERGEHVRHMAKHLLGFFTGCPGARAFRRYLSQHMWRSDADVTVVDRALAVSGLGDTAALERTGT